MNRLARIAQVERARALPCPVCAAAAGEKCASRSTGGKLDAVHTRRIFAAGRDAVPPVAAEPGDPAHG